MDKYIGKTLGGRYEIIDIVGIGGMAIVYRARCHVLNRYVAVKVLKEEYAKDPDIRKRFSIESQAVAKLSHHNIVSVYDVGEENGTDYIVMELMEGVTLKEYLQKKGHLSSQEALFFAQQICRALIHAHSRGIIHQDIKPQNIIILRDGTAKLTDFGIASFAAAQETKVVQEAIGSVHYISPEQAKGAKIDYRTDIYSLGVVMYEMLTGKLPFDGETAIQVVMQHLNAVPLMPSELEEGISEGMDEIVMHAMCANINKRYASADALYADLEELKNNQNAVFHYGKENENAHATQILDADVQKAARRTPVAPERDSAAVRTKQRTEVREPEGFFEKLGERPGLAAVVAVSIFAVIALIVFGILIGSGNKGKVTVPTFMGQMIDDVLANEEYKDQFTLVEASERKTSTAPVGEIIEQSIGPGRKISKGTKITLTVSMGEAEEDTRYEIPDFKGKELEYVTTILERQNIGYETPKEEFSEDIEKGLVIKTDPAAGRKISDGQKVTIYISKGKEEKEFEMPNLYGKSQAEAEKIISDKKLIKGEVTSITSEEPIGTVVWQSPEAGTKVKEGKTINFSVSKGKQKPEENKPEEENNGSGDPNYVDPESGTSTIGTATIPVSFSSDSAHIIISAGESVLYEGTETSESGSVNISVKGPMGQQNITINVDGNVSTSTVTFT